MARTAKDKAEERKQKKQKEHGQEEDDDGDDSSDEDYVPPADDDDDVPGVGIRGRPNTANEGRETLARPGTQRAQEERKKRMESIWAEMQEIDKTNVSTVMRRKRKKGEGGKEGGGAEKKKKHHQKARALLAGIFGKSTAASMVTGLGEGGRERGGEREARQAVLKAHASRTTVMETKKFAGQEVQVKRVVVGAGGAGAAAAAAATNGGAKKGRGLESVLKEIKGPESISTIAKSSTDWDAYKVDKGIAEELAQATKDGFLAKKDFLEDCDVRLFERERDERNAHRAREVGGSGGGGGGGGGGL